MTPQNRLFIIHTLIVGYVVLSICDVAITLILLSTGDYIEVNPLAGQVYHLWKNNGLIIYKFVAVTSVITVLYAITFFSQRVALRLMIGTNIFMAAIVIYSIILLGHAFLGW